MTVFSALENSRPVFAGANPITKKLLGKGDGGAFWDVVCHVGAVATIAPQVIAAKCRQTLPLQE
ncbi:hypothetical protein ACI2KS_28345 [Pseudomonas sp. NPDC087358]|uniref:hypothetical protein n=1 Tax=Pseudomonas sp. NPDC087358 TaxID=3364439 RepID=UPI00384FBC89